MLLHSALFLLKIPMLYLKWSCMKSTLITSQSNYSSASNLYFFIAALYTSFESLDHVLMQLFVSIR